MKAWHFVGEKLRDGGPIPDDGQSLIHSGEIKLCKSGFHASKRIIDALRYAPGLTICRVDCGGEIIYGDDKLVCTERTVLWRVDGEELLRNFARMCALDVIHLWDAPDVVVKYLKTGDATIREAATDSAWDATRAAATDAAWVAARAAARAAATDSAWDAAWDAARDSATDAAWDAATDAARDSAWDAARDSATDAAWDAATDAARDSAWDATREKQNRRLERMVREARK